MEEQYDLDALYLYYDSWGGHRIGRIVKVNEKTIRMENNVRILKENFFKVYKLSDQEVNIFNGELIKRTSIHIHKVKEAAETLMSLKALLKNNEFINLNTEKLQKNLDILNEELNKNIPQIMKINNKDYKFMEYSDKLEEVIE